MYAQVLKIGLSQSGSKLILISFLLNLSHTLSLQQCPPWHENFGGGGGGGEEVDDEGEVEENGKWFYNLYSLWVS